MRIYEIEFISKELKQEILNLKTNPNEKELYISITKAITQLRKKPTKGIKIPKKLWPKEYLIKYKITNLWKINLTKGWRLIYTIKANDIKIISIILDYLPHKKYERKFKYS